MARTAAGSRSGMDEYELHGHLNEKLFRAIGNCFENLSSSVGSISEEIYSRQAVYLSYTLVSRTTGTLICFSPTLIKHRASALSQEQTLACTITLAATAPKPLSGFGVRPRRGALPVLVTR